MNKTIDSNVVDADEPVWTGTLATGAASDASCNEWRAPDKYLGQYGRPQLGEAWTDVNRRPCDSPAHLYCFEVVPE